MKTLVLIDSNAIVHRAYHALPKNLSNKKGELTNVTYGFALALIKILEEIKPDYLAASFDLAAPTFRHIEYKEYKATRVKADQELYDQIPRVREMLAAFGIPIYAVEGFEADDVIGTIVEFCNGHNKKCQVPGDDLVVYIASGDRDVYQLLNGHVRVLMLKHGFSEAEVFDTSHLKEVYNLEPKDFIDLKALMGDASDNIPGIPGIGPKTATELLLRFDTLEKIYQEIEKSLSGHHSELTRQAQGKLREESGSSRRSHAASPRSFTDVQDDKGDDVQDNKEGIRDDILKVKAKELGIKERILRLLIEYKDQAFMSQHLATIRRDVPIGFDLEGARWGQYDKDKLRQLFEELEFRSLLMRFSKGWAETKEPKNQRTEEQGKKDDQLRLEL
ncbi:MAG: 5'-3' exonuclease H3TH domain-containing protein [Patescibacteria group bacterium]|jgi:DNA polymerase-1